ncbi:MAG TPA: hypothetical protein VF151_11020 [Gemmatimonadales bacterium]
MDEVFDYRCYHCKQVFRGALAEAHFGTTPDAMARCIAMTSRDSFGDPHAPFVPFKMFKHEVERRESAEAALRIASERADIRRQTLNEVHQRLHDMKNLQRASAWPHVEGVARAEKMVWDLIMEVSNGTAKR